MRLLAFLALLVLALFFQLGPARFVEVGGVGPDLVSLLVLHLALAERFERVFFLQWLAGAAKDLASGGDPGLYATGCLLAGILLSRFRDEFFAEHVLTRGLLALGVSLQIHLVAVFVVFLRHPHLDPFDLFLRAGGVALYTAVVSPLALVALSRALPPREKRS